jgi:hypothetical protein
MLVSSDGTTTRAAALAGSISNPSKPIATVGRPIPVTPLTRPASTKVSAMARTCDAVACIPET